MTASLAKPQVLLLDPIVFDKALLAELEERYEVLPLTSTSRSDFLDECKSGKYAGVKAFYRHFKGSSNKVLGLIDAELFAGLPKDLFIIASNGSGYDAIDVAAASSHNVQVANVPVAVDNATADTALFLLLGAIRQFGQAQTALRAGTFNTGLPLSNDPKGKVLGIVGMGGIGRALALRVRALGMTVQYYNRNQLEPELEQGAKYVSFEELLKTSDVISLNLPLNAKTKHTIGKEQFKTMKKSAILINTARGGVIDEAAMVDALNEGEIAGVGLDVYEEEPKIHPGLLASPKAFLLPHVGTVTLETQTEMESVCLRNIDIGLKTGKLPYVVAEQKGQF